MALIPKRSPETRIKEVVIKFDTMYVHVSYDVCLFMRYNVIAKIGRAKYNLILFRV